MQLDPYGVHFCGLEYHGNLIKQTDILLNKFTLTYPTVEVDDDTEGETVVDNECPEHETLVVPVLNIKGDDLTTTRSVYSFSVFC